jgi:tetratricopeptide (TPR) repeat protein
MSHKPEPDMTPDAESLASEGKYAEAIAMCRDAVIKCAAASGETSEQLIRPLAALANSIARYMRTLSKESLTVATQAADIAIEHFGAHDIRTARVLAAVSLSLRESGLTAESLAYQSRALSIAEGAGEAEDALRFLRYYTATLVSAEKYSEALELCARLHGREEERAEGVALKIMASYQLGLCLLRLGQKNRAASYLQRAFDLQTRLKPEASGGELERLLREAKA